MFLISNGLMYILLLYHFTSPSEPQLAIYPLNVSPTAYLVVKRRL